MLTLPAGNIADEPPVMKLSNVILRLALVIAVVPFAQTGMAGDEDRDQGAGAHHDRFPGEQWMQYADVAEAGFSPQRLARAKRFWKKRNSPAFIAVSGGAVVASWGEVDRRFMCHSIRKSLLSALYGVYRDDIDLQLTLAELGIDDKTPLTAQEKQARVVDLIRSRSGVYLEAAAEVPDRRPARGSHEPGSHWWYNNWDFNVAGVVFEQLTGERIFEAFEKAIADPIGMQDYRISDGYYHYEHGKSAHAAYPFRMSSRDLARFGLLYARGGRWKDDQVIRSDWIEESTRAHSEVDMGTGNGSAYGYMWWIEGSEGFTARGMGGHILAVYPRLDLIMVVRADTYHEKSLSTRACMMLFDKVRSAGGGRRADDPRLLPLAPSAAGDTPGYSLPVTGLDRYSCEIEMESGGKVRVGAEGGVLTVDFGQGTYELRPESDTRFIAEDLEDPFLFDLAEDGRVTAIWAERLCYLEATAAVKRGDLNAARSWLQKAVEKFPESSRTHFNLARILHATGKSPEALPHVRRALAMDPKTPGAAALLRALQFHRLSWVIGIVALMVVFLVMRALVRKRRLGQAQALAGRSRE